MNSGVLNATRLAQLGWRNSVGATRLAQLGWRNSVGATRLAQRGWRNAVGATHLYDVADIFECSHQRCNLRVTCILGMT
jgi:hypothetical protein